MSIFEHDQYKSFLASYIERLPKKGRGEFTRLANHLGVSTTLVSQVLSGDKHFSLEQAEGIAMYLGLAEIETDYFFLLINSERAGTISLRKYYAQKAAALKQQALKLSNRLQPEKNLTDQEMATFYSSHYYAAVWLFTSVGKDGKSIVEICERFEFTRVKALEILKFLTNVKLCEEKNGRYAMGPQSVHVGTGSPHLLHHFRNWRIQAIHQSETMSLNELMYTAAVSLSVADFEKLREEMVVFIQNLLRRAHASPAENIACFNLDFFWIKK